MKSVVRTAALLVITLLALYGCAAFPTTRTFYEPDPADGVPRNRSSCGYTTTRDSVQRVIQEVEIVISPGKEELPSQPEPSLEASIQISVPIGMTNLGIDAANIQLEVDGVVLKPEIISSTSRSAHVLRGYIQRNVIDLHFPPPSGLSNQLKFVFQSGALKINGVPLAIAPFRFTRVTKSDIYYGSINC